MTEDGNLQLVDFGLATMLSDLGHARRLATSPGYTAPEVFSSAPPATVQDVYAMGMVMHILLCGRLPHAHSALASIAMSPPMTESLAAIALHSPPGTAQARGLPDERRLSSQLHGDLDAIAARCIAIDPGQRYASVAELADDLRHWLRREPVDARNGGLFYRGTKLLKRHRLASALAALVLSTAAIGTAVSWKSQRHAARETASLQALTRIFEQTLGTATLSGLGTDTFSSADLLAKTEMQMRQLSLQDYPRVQRRGLLMLARNHAVIGDYARAAELADEAEHLSGTHDAVTLAEVQATRATLQNIAGDAASALQTAQAALAAIAGSRDAHLLPARLQLMTETARAQWNLIQRKDALHSLDQALTLAEAHPANLPEARAELLALRGHWLVHEQQFERADQDLHEAIALAGATRPLLAAEIQRTLVRSLTMQGRPAEARETAEQQWQNTRHVLGNTHPHTGNALLALGNSRCNEGDVAGCQEAIDQGKALILAAHGHDHPDYGLALAYRAWSLQAGNADRDKVIALSREALSILKQHYPPSHEMVMGVQTLLAYRIASQLPQTEEEERSAALQESIALLESVLASAQQAGMPPPHTTRRYLAYILMERSGEEDLMRAEALLLENRAFLEQNYPRESHVHTLNQLLIVQLYLERGRLEEADAMCMALQSRANSQLPIPQAFSTLNRCTLTRAFIATHRGQSQQARAILREHLQLIQQDHPDTHRYVTRTMAVIQELEQTGTIRSPP